MQEPELILHCLLATGMTNALYCPFTHTVYILSSKMGDPYLSCRGEGQHTPLRSMLLGSDDVSTDTAPLIADDVAANAATARVTSVDGEAGQQVGSGLRCWQ